MEGEWWISVNGGRVSENGGRMSALSVNVGSVSASKCQHIVGQVSSVSKWGGRVSVNVGVRKIA